MVREIFEANNWPGQLRKQPAVLWQSLMLVLIGTIMTVMTVMAPLAQAGSAISTDTPVICSNTFALCSCEVTKGANYGTSVCGDRDAVVNKTGATQLVSTYALTQSASKPVLSCETGHPWTDCLDYPCVVDPLNPLKAICSCAIQTTGDFVTYGGDCNVRTCKDAYWSAAAPSDFQAGTDALVQALGITSDPVTYCPPNEVKKQ